MTMKQHFPQYTLAVLLGLVLAGCHGPEYSDQVYDEDKLYEYDNDEGNTIRGWTVTCDGPAIRLAYGGVLYNGQLYGSAEIRTARDLGVDGVTFYHSSTLHISSDGSTTICNFLCDDSAISSPFLTGNVDITSWADVTASDLSGINLSVSAINGMTDVGKVCGGNVEISGKSVTLGFINYSDGVKIQASDSVTLQGTVYVKDNLSVSRIIQPGYMSTAPNISIDSDVEAGGVINLSGINIEGTDGSAHFLARAYYITGAGSVNIQQRFVGGDELKVTANNDVQLGSLEGISGSTVLTSA